MPLNDKTKTWLMRSGILSSGMIFIASVILNFNQFYDIKDKDVEIDFLLKKLQRTEEKSEIFRKNWKKRDGAENNVCFDTDSLTNEVLLKKINKSFNTKSR